MKQEIQLKVSAILRMVYIIQFSHMGKAMGSSFNFSLPLRIVVTEHESWSNILLPVIYEGLTIVASDIGHLSTFSYVLK